MKDFELETSHLGGYDRILGGKYTCSQSISPWGEILNRGCLYLNILDYFRVKVSGS